MKDLDNEKYYDFELKSYLTTLGYCEDWYGNMVLFGDNYSISTEIEIPKNFKYKTIGECWDMLENKYDTLVGQREFFKSWYRNEFMKIINDYKKEKEGQSI